MVRVSHSNWCYFSPKKHSFAYPAWHCPRMCGLRELSRGLASLRHPGPQAGGHQEQWAGEAGRQGHTAGFTRSLQASFCHLLLLCWEAETPSCSHSPLFLPSVPHPQLLSSRRIPLKQVVVAVTSPWATHTQLGPGDSTMHTV